MIEISSLRRIVHEWNFRSGGAHHTGKMLVFATGIAPGQGFNFANRVMGNTYTANTSLH